MRKKDSRRKKLSLALQSIWSVTVEKLSAVLPESAMEEWVNHFELVDLSMKSAVIRMNGNGDLNRFQDLYYDTFADCLFEVLGYEVNIKFKQKKTGVQHSRVAARRIALLLLSLLFLALAVMAVVVGINYVQNMEFQETFYQVSSGKITRELRIIQLSDLHNTVFDENNNDLVRRIEKLEPDLIVMTGDMIDQNDESWDVTLDLCRRLTGVAPVYYIYGNNERKTVFEDPMTLESLDQRFSITEGSDTFRSPELLASLEDGLCARLEETGVQVLRNEGATIQVAGNTVDVYGILTANPSSFWPYAGETAADFLYGDTDHFKLLLSHEPYIFQELRGEYWGDLALCGHTHGGVIRVPKLGGLYEQAEGLFPERQGAYVLGQYSVNGTPLIVSGGLTNRGMIRVNDQPELVIVDVNRY